MSATFSIYNANSQVYGSIPRSNSWSAQSKSENIMNCFSFSGGISTLWVRLHHEVPYAMGRISAYFPIIAWGSILFTYIYIFSLLVVLQTRFLYLGLCISIYLFPWLSLRYTLVSAAAYSKYIPTYSL